MRAMLCLLVCLLLSASARAQQCPIPRDYWPTDGWRHATPAAENVDSAMLDSALTHFGTLPANVYAAMVVRHGYVIGERYYHGKDSTSRYELRSATKTIVSILTGIAIDRKLLRSVDQPVVPLIPEFASRSDSVDPRKAKITIRNLLTMQSGLNWIEGHGPEYLNYQPNWPVAILSQPMTADPGTKFNYSSGNAHLLSTIVSRATHQTTVAFANENLFQPIGFTLPLLEWSTDPQGVNAGGAGLNLTANEMARIGYLFLNNGCWDGKQVVSTKWVADSHKNWSNPGKGSGGYGYLWWLSVSVPGAYAAEGHGGQYIFVDPVHDSIIIITAEPNSGGNDFEPARTLINPAMH